MSKLEVKHSNRLETLDHLRGFFIVVIIIDHLSRFPSLLSILSGKAVLWVTAAEGFVIISGLLVGYVRGYKNRNEPFKDVAIKLLRRAGLLYFWSILASIIYVAIIWYVPLQGGFPSTPMPAGDWKEFLAQLFTLRYTYVWVYFLTLYAVFLAFAPIAVWFLRRNQAWVVGITSFVLLLIGWLTQSEVLQWQFLFFIPSILGYYLDSILGWWRSLGRSRRIALMGTTIGLTVVTITLSVISTFYNLSYWSIADTLNNAIFAKDSISLARAGMAFLWFTGYLFVFYLLRKWIKRFFGWLLLPVGTASLTAYILHGVALCIISFFVARTEDFWINTLLGATAVLITWGLLKIPIIRRIVPA